MDSPFSPMGGFRKNVPDDARRIQALVKETLAREAAASMAPLSPKDQKIAAARQREESKLWERILGKGGQLVLSRPEGLNAADKERARQLDREMKELNERLDREMPFSTPPESWPDQWPEGFHGTIDGCAGRRVHSLIPLKLNILADVEYCLSVGTPLSVIAMRTEVFADRADLLRNGPPRADTMESQDILAYALHGVAIEDSFRFAVQVANFYRGLRGMKPGRTIKTATAGVAQFRGATPEDTDAFVAELGRRLARAREGIGNRIVGDPGQLIAVEPGQVSLAHADGSGALSAPSPAGGLEFAKEPSSPVAQATRGPLASIRRMLGKLIAGPE